MTIHSGDFYTNGGQENSMKKWWFNSLYSMWSKKELEHSCGLSKATESFGLIENNREEEDPSRNDTESLGPIENNREEEDPNRNDTEKSIPNYKHLWILCENCYGLNYKKFLKMKICEQCGYHLKMSSSERIELPIDRDTWNPMDEDMVSIDAIGWDSVEDQDHEMDPIEFDLEADQDHEMDPIEFDLEEDQDHEMDPIEFDLEEDQDHEIELDTNHSPNHKEDQNHEIELDTNHSPNHNPNHKEDKNHEIELDINNYPSPHHYPNHEIELDPNHCPHRYPSPHHYPNHCPHRYPSPHHYPNHEIELDINNYPSPHHYPNHKEDQNHEIQLDTNNYPNHKEDQNHEIQLDTNHNPNHNPNHKEDQNHEIQLDTNHKEDQDHEMEGYQDREEDQRDREDDQRDREEERYQDREEDQDHEMERYQDREEDQRDREDDQRDSEDDQDSEEDEDWEDEDWEEEGYQNRLDYYTRETGLTEAVQTGIGQLNGIPVAIGVMDFQFMGGSMGSVVGEKITRLIEYATKNLLPLIIVCASGGARMQEGSLSLMQMAKISAALYNYQSNPKLFYVSILTSPTTGGVTASFGMLGDIIIAEPNAYIAFAGKRVIEQLLNTTVPEGAQEAENLFDKGLFDPIVPRNLLKGVLSELFQLHAFYPL